MSPKKESTKDITASNTQDNTKEERLKALKITIERLEKAYGKGTIMRLDNELIEDIPSVPTGSIGLDIILGTKGLPKGRVIEIYGPESSGKTTLTLHCIAETQKKGGIAAFIDAEHAFDKKYAKNLGIDTENLLVSQPDYGEQGLEIAEQLIRSGSIDILVIDSVAALVPKGELQGEMGDNKLGLQARLMSQALRKLTAVVSRTGCVCIFINQLREKIGAYGNPETTTGGNALKFYASVRLDIRRIGAVKKGEEIIGNKTRVKVVKNKVAPPFRTIEFDIIYGSGISFVAELADISVAFGLMKKSGSWYYYEDEKIGQGRDKVIALLEDNEALQEKLRGQIWENVKNKSNLAQTKLEEGLGKVRETAEENEPIDKMETAEENVPIDDAVAIENEEETAEA